MKTKYIEFRTRPFNLGRVVAIKDVSLYNKRGIEAQFKDLESKLPGEYFAGCLIVTNNGRPRKEFVISAAEVKTILEAKNAEV